MTRDLDSVPENIIEVDRRASADRSDGMIGWDWDGKMQFRASAPGSRWYANAAHTLDPAPAYGHDIDVVIDAYRRVRAAFPMADPQSPCFYLVPYEFASRTNAYSHATSLPEPDDWPEEAAPPWTGVIGLCAKRIPPMPGRTRYLVAHEYGHIAEEWIKETLLGHHRMREDQRLMDDYAVMRGLDDADFDRGATPGRWHRSIDEVFACDFRIAVCGIEPDYWPHPGFAHPQRHPDVIDWWADIVAKNDALR